jgi:hypothetical protein
LLTGINLTNGAKTYIFNPDGVFGNHWAWRGGGIGSGGGGSNSTDSYGLRSVVLVIDGVFFVDGEFIGPNGGIAASLPSGFHTCASNNRRTESSNCLSLGWTRRRPN